MSKAIKSVGNVLGFGETAKIKPQIADKSLFDITPEAQAAQQAYNPLLQSSQANQQAVAPGQQQALAQMALAATGKGPSLAEAQLRGAQDRGFAQQLAAAQAMRAQSPALAQRQLLLNMGNANRDLAQQSAIQRLQERDAFLNQANQVQNSLRTDVQNKFNLDTAPKTALQQWENQRVGAVNQAQAANAAATGAKRGALFSAIGSTLGNLGAQGTFSGSSAPGTPGMKDGGLVSTFARKLEELRRSGDAGSGPKTTQQLDDAKKAKEKTDREKRDAQDRAIRNLACGGQVTTTHEYKAGGSVDGPGTETSDSIPTMLSDGEFVVKAAVVKKPGMLELLEKINNSSLSTSKAKKELAHYGHVLAARKKDK